MTRVHVEGLLRLGRVNLDVTLDRKASRGMVMKVLRCVYELLLLRVKDVARVLIPILILIMR